MEVNSPLNSLNSLAKSNITCSHSSSFFCSNLSSNIFSLPHNLNIFMLVDIKLQLSPILYAVFILSPVNIHIFIFASLKSCIVSGTLSCNLSSTIVQPNK